ncbi:TPA: hypothetical protein ACGD2I_004492 [Aeromonas hydrophila]|uniref:hypothetical protein n=1 Tax=Aeromonas hydrophila TaxID=644 RepID=UPI0021E9352A|nr:hypothetical protein [Aeromonas hydrophila]MCV3295352.1 hypothetical protein [Aeromonas hydrophila]
MYSEQNGLRVKLPAFVANDLIKYLPEGMKPTRFIVNLILMELAKKKRGSHTSDDAIRDNNEVV